MAKTKNAIEVADERPTAFVVPFSLEAFREDILEVYFHYVRIMGLITDDKTAWALTGASPLKDDYEFYSPEYNATDLGLRYAQIRDTQFAKGLEQLYNYAFLGRWDASAEAMGDETYYTWLSGLACDVLNSDISAEWEAFGLDIHSHAHNCVLVAETANARHTLEGGEPFGHFTRGVQRAELLCDGALTIRQMALLSGMEEMSVRAAANPKRANPLVKEPQEGVTRFAIDVAKAWLQSKGQYIPITIYRSAGEVDLSKRGFSNYFDLWHALNARFLMLADRDGSKALKKKLGTIGVDVARGAQNDCLNIENGIYANEKVMASLADILELPKELLLLRCKETIATEQLAEVTRQLREAVQAPTAVKSN